MNKSPAHYVLLAFLVLATSLSLGYLVTGNMIEAFGTGFGLGLVCFAILLSQGLKQSSLKYKTYTRLLAVIFAFIPVIITVLTFHWMYIFVTAPGFGLASVTFAIAAGDNSIFPNTDHKTYQLASILLCVYVALAILSKYLFY